MCGVIGYVGRRRADRILLEGLKRLEYRGYDSAGIAVMQSGRIRVGKRHGKIRELERTMPPGGLPGFSGIGHTRWATHGEPNTKNAHPHLDGSGKIAVVHNGIVENYLFLKSKLEQKGVRFRSDTDTEVLAHLIADVYEGDLSAAVARALRAVKGTYGLLVIHSDHPDTVVGARHGSPLLAGIGNGEILLASDTSAVIAHTKNIVYLEDNELVVVSGNEFRTTDLDLAPVDKKVHTIKWDLEEIEKEGFEHFMLKEIFQQPEAVANTFRGRILGRDGTVKLGGLEPVMDRLRCARRILIVACGTAYYAGMVGEYLFEELAGIPTEVEFGSELRYRNPIVEPDTLAVIISQSGETADSLMALREVQRKGGTCIGIINVVGSTIARECGAGVYVHAGPELGVASTKAFTCQVMALGLISILMARMRHMSRSEGVRLVREIQKIPEKIAKVLKTNPAIRKVAKKYSAFENFLYLGRGINYPIALEGALKLKEISYIHAEGYPGAEMKHGPIAMIDRNFPVVGLATGSVVSDKMISNIEEIRARRGRTILVANPGDRAVTRLADDLLYVPEIMECFSPIINVVALQLFAYHIGVARGFDVDKPRNLAKSVTVE